MSDSSDRYDLEIYMSLLRNLTNYALFKENKKYMSVELFNQNFN